MQVKHAWSSCPRSRPPGWSRGSVSCCRGCAPWRRPRKRRTRCCGPSWSCGWRSLNAAAVVLTGYGTMPPERAAQVMAMLLGVPVSAGRADKASGRLAAQLGKAGFDAAMLAALAGEKALAADETPVNVLDSSLPSGTHLGLLRAEDAQAVMLPEGAKTAGSWLPIRIPPLAWSLRPGRARPPSGRHRVAAAGRASRDHGAWLRATRRRRRSSRSAR
jgi:hypothetical protein